MTPPTQDDLAAGRELDKRVAEEIFGYVAWAVPRHSGAHAGDVVWLMQPRDAILAPPPELPCYRTDISAAWQLVEYLADTLPLEQFNLFKAAFERPNPPMWAYRAPALATAICRAALKVVSAQP